MQKVSQVLAPMFQTRSPYARESITRDLYEVIEFYPATYLPHTIALPGGGSYFGFNPAEAFARFASTSAVWQGNSYRRATTSRTPISRYLTSQFNDVTFTFSNVTRYFSFLVQNYQIEGMWVVVRRISRTLSPTLADSAILFTGRLDKPSDITRERCTIKARQRIASIEQEVPYRKFIAPCPLEFKGPACTGPIPASAHTAAWQAAATCDKSVAQCTEYGNLDLRQGFQFNPEPGTFPIVTQTTKTVLWVFKKKKTVITTGQFSSKDVTPYDTPVPVAIGRVRVEGVPVFGVDAGSSVNGIYVFSEGKINKILDLMTPTAGYTGPVFLYLHLGDFGGTGTNNGDAQFPHQGKFSRTAYASATFWGGTPETQSDLPSLVGTLLGMEMPLPNSVTGQFLAEGWSDNNAIATRWWLTDSRILNQPAALIDDAECVTTAAHCDETIIDESGGQQTVLTTPEVTALQNRQVAHYRSSADVNMGYQRYRLGLDPVDAWLDNPMTPDDYEVFDGGQAEVPPVVVPNRYYRRRYSLNLYLNDTERAHDILFKTILPSFRGYILYGPDGRMKIKSERPASSVLLRGSVQAGDTEIAVDSVDEWAIPAAVPVLTDYALSGNGSVATATSSFSAGDVPAYAINGTRAAAPYWRSGAPATALAPQTFTVNFNALRTLTKLDIFSYGDNPTAPPTPDLTFTQYGLIDFDIEYFDGAAWLPLPNGQIRNNSLVWRSIQFPALQATQIRIKISRAATATDGYARLMEVEAYDTTPRLQNTKIALIGTGLVNGEARTVVGTRYSTVGNLITLASNNASIVRSGATFAGSNGDQVTASATLTVNAVPAAGTQVVITIDGVAIPYVVEAGGTTGTLAAMLASVINADRTIRRYVKASHSTAAPNVVTLRSKLGFLKLERAAARIHSIAEEVIEVQAVFTPENTVGGTFTWPKGDRQSSINRIVIKFRNSANDYQETEFHLNDYAHQALVGKINPLEIDGRAIDSYHQAYRIASSALSKLREGDFFCEWSGGPGSALLDEGDVVAISDPSSGFILLPLRIEECQISEKLICAFVGRLYSTLMYSDEVARHTIPLPSALKSLSEAPPVATDLVLSETGGYTIDGSFNHRIRGAFNFQPYFADQYAEVWLKRPIDVDYQLVERVPSSADPNFLSATFEIRDVDIGRHYVKVVVKNNVGSVADVGHPEELIDIAQPAPTWGVVSDTSPMRGTDAGLFLYFAARRDPVYDAALAWFGADVWQDRGYGWERIGALTTPATIGTAQAVLSGAGLSEGDIDATSLVVYMPGLAGYATAASEADVLAGTNNFMFGGEKIGVMNIAPHATPGYFYFSNIIRGMQMTGHAITGHTLYESLVRIDEGLVAIPANFGDLLRGVNYRLVTFGQNLSDAPIQSVNLRGNSLRPYLVTDRYVVRDSSLDWLISFEGRPKESEMPADYMVEVWADATRNNPANLKRTLPILGGVTMAALLYQQAGTPSIVKNSVTYSGSTGLFQSARSYNRLTQTGSWIEGSLVVGSGSDVNFNLLRFDVLTGVYLIEYGLRFNGLLGTVDVYDYRHPVDGNPIIASFSGLYTSAATRWRIMFVGTEVRFYKDYENTHSKPFFILPGPPTFPYVAEYTVTYTGSGPVPQATNLKVNSNGKPYTIYSLSQQERDFGAAQANLHLRIYQNSAYPGITGYPLDVEI